MRRRRSPVMPMIVLVGLAAVTAGCGVRSGESLSNAGLDRAPVTQPPPSTPPPTAAPGETLPPVETTAPPTTLPTKLDTLPKCDPTALDNASGTVNITFWHGLSNELGTALQNLTDAYNASQTKVHVDLQFQGGYDENITKYLASNTANRPDMVQMPEYMVQQMIDTKSIVPTQACAEATGYDMSDFIPAALGAYETQGVQWSMPFNMSVPVLFFLKPRLTAAGLDAENPPDTLDELFEQGKQIVSSGAASYSIALDSDFDGGGGWYIEQWLSKGGYFYADNENGRAAPATKVVYDDPPGLALMTYLQKLVTEGGGVYVGPNASGQDALLKLADASAPAAMTISTSASLGVVLSVLGSGLIPGITTDQVGVGYMPGPNGGLGALVGGASLYIVDGKGADKAAAAWDYIQYLEKPESQSQFAADTGYIPVRESSVDLDPLKTVYSTDPRFRVAYDQLLGSTDAPTSRGPVIGPLEQVRKVTADAVAAVLTGADPQASLSAAAQQADDLITNYNVLNPPSG